MFEAYSVGVRLSLINGVSHGLLSIISQLQSVNHHFGLGISRAEEFEGRLRRIKSLSIVGAGATAVGLLGLSLFKAPIEAAREYETAYARFKTLNLGDEVNKQADAFASGAQRFGTSSAQMMDTFRESYAFFGNMSQASVAATKIAELNAANAVLFGGKVGSIDSEATKSLMRFADMRGDTNTPADFFRTLNLAQRMVTGSGGSMKFGDLEAFAKTGGTAFKSLSDAGIIHLGSAMQEMGGSRTGTALMTMYQNLVAGRATTQAKHALEDLGLAKLVEQKVGAVGGRTQTRLISEVNPEFLSMLRTDPVMALSKFMMPAIEQRLGAGATDDQRSKVINDLFSNRTGSNLATGVALQMVQVLRDSKFIAGAQGVDQTIKTAQGTTDGQLVELQARWRDVLKELGVTVLPLAIRAAKALSGALGTISEAARAHPTLTKFAALTAGAVSGLVVLGGTIALVKAGFGGLGLLLGGVGLPGGIALGTLATGLASSLGLVGAALFAVWQTTKLFDAVGELVGAKTRSGVGLTPEAAARLKAGEGAEVNFKGRPSVVPGPAQGSVRMVTHISMDGRKVAEAVSDHQASAARKPSAGTSGPDYSAALPPLFIATAH